MLRYNFTFQGHNCIQIRKNITDWYPKWALSDMPWWVNNKVKQMNRFSSMISLSNYSLSIVSPLNITYKRMKWDLFYF